MSLKAFCNEWGECNWMEVISGHSSGVLQYWHNGGGFEAWGETSWTRERLKMSMKTMASCPAQALNTQRGIPSMPGAILIFSLLKMIQMPLVENKRDSPSGERSIELIMEGSRVGHRTGCFEVSDGLQPPFANVICKGGIPHLRLALAEL